MAPPRVVVDTNVWVSAFLNPRGYPARLILRWRAGDLRVVTSPPLLDELARVLARPRLQRVRPFTDTEARLYLLMIQAGAEVVTPTGQLRICRDASDDLVLETALLGRARYLVSRDADMIRDLSLVRLFAKPGVRIATVQQFLRLLASK
ncbi:MAG TPA: putative toxin-antitoxin system toxin component, PIN family [archaeon]|nr:putative toxin-antitoxin system toxin component, PIN family [archaeon]